MSSTVRIADSLKTKLYEIAGLLTVQRLEPVKPTGALEWLFEQLPKDYLEKLKEDALLLGDISFSPVQKEKMIAQEL